MESFRELKVYQRAYEESLKIHQETQNFPKYEQYELGSQMRRASKSVAMNIAEGFGKNDSLADFKRFMKMALGSSAEVRVQLDYCKDLGYISEEDYNGYEESYVIISRMLVKMIRSWKKTEQ